MSVSLVVPIQRRPFRGYTDPGLPEGIWIVQSSVLGDAGGGSLNFDILFKDGSLPVPESSLMYSLEQLMIFLSRNTPIIPSINPANWDEITPGATGATSHVWRADLSTMSLTNGAAGEIREVTPPRAWFLGQVRKNVTNTIIRITVPNDASSISVKAEGYIWGPRSLNSAGGPRRPADSLYG